MRLRFLAAALLVVALANSAWSHTRSESYSNWQVTETGATGVITVSSGEVITLMDMAAPQPLDRLFIEHAAQSTAVSSENGRCEPRTPLALDSPWFTTRTHSCVTIVRDWRIMSTDPRSRQY